MADSRSFPGYPGTRKCIPTLSTPSIVTFFDGSRVNPINEASLVLDRITSLDDENISWLVTTADHEPCGTHSSKFSLFQSDLGSPLSLYKDYKRVFDINSELSSCFSSISVARSLSFSSFSDDLSEIMELEECSIDKPLFWPYDLIPEWGSNPEWDFFVMSPRKTKKMDFEKVGTRNLLFGSRSNSSANLDFKTTNDSRVVRKMKSMPSRFKKSGTINENVGTRESLDDKDVIERKCKNGVLLEDHLLVEKLNDERAIETILGLDEFDGHEGIESEFDKDSFSLDVFT